MRDRVSQELAFIRQFPHRRHLPTVTFMEWFYASKTVTGLGKRRTQFARTRRRRNRFARPAGKVKKIVVALFV